MKLIQSYTGTARVNTKSLTLPKVKGDQFSAVYELLEKQTSSATLTYTLIDPIVNPRTFENVPRGGIIVWCNDENILTLLSLGWG
jgi:hypothetical protein